MLLKHAILALPFLLEPTPTEGGNGNANNPPPAASGDGGKTQGEMFQALLEKHKGDSNAVAAMLHGENHQLRRKNRDLAARVPEGSVVLTADEAKAWRSYRQLGDDPKALKTDLEAGRAARTTLADIEATKALKGFGEAAGYSPDVFARLAKQDGIELEAVEVKGKDGKAVVRVLVKGEDGEEGTPIDRYAEQHWAEFLPALKPTGDGQGKGRLSTPRAAGQGRAVPPARREQTADESRQGPDVERQMMNMYGF